MSGPPSPPVRVMPGLAVLSSPSRTSSHTVTPALGPTSLPSRRWSSLLPPGAVAVTQSGLTTTPGVGVLIGSTASGATCGCQNAASAASLGRAPTRTWRGTLSRVRRLPGGHPDPGRRSPSGLRRSSPGPSCQPFRRGGLLVACAPSFAPRGRACQPRASASRSRLMQLLSPTLTRSARLSIRSRQPLVLADRGLDRLTFAMQCGRPRRISFCASSLRLSTSFYEARYPSPSDLSCVARPSWPYASPTGLFVPSPWARLSVVLPARSPLNSSPSVHAPFWSLYSLGVKTSNGCEAIIHTTRQWFHRHRLDPTKTAISVDISNAFNTVHRSAVLQSVRTHFPSLVPWVDCCYRHDSHLFTGSATPLVLPSLLWPFIRPSRRLGGTLSSPFHRGSTSAHFTLTTAFAQTPLQR